jgi:hypothetical protein
MSAGRVRTIGRHVGRFDVEKRVERLARSVAEIEVALRGAEGKIEADARKRIRTLHNEARRQLVILRGHQREATRLLWRLSTAAEGSWDDLMRAADRALTEARTVADSIIERLRAVARSRGQGARSDSRGAPRGDQPGAFRLSRRGRPDRAQVE